MFVAIAALLGCAEDPDPLDPLATLSAPGPHAVGYREEATGWTEPGLQDERRDLRIAAWYPTEADEGEEVRYQGLWEAPGVLGGAPPLEGSHPLAVFSHGHQGFAENSSFIAEHLASHGWWVLAPEHAGNTTWDGPDRDTAIYWQRPLDVRAALDHAEATLPLAGPVVVIGHSFGGYTVHGVGGGEYAIDAIEPQCADGTDTSPFCSTMTPAQADRFRAGFLDERVSAAISMAPGDWRLFGAGLGDVAVPVLLMTGGLDPGTDGDPTWADLDHDGDRRVHLPTAGHNAFTDLGALLDPDEAIDPAEGERIVRTFALAFAGARALGDPLGEPLLDGEVPVSDLAEVSAH
jgi:predicted dienelactone hydrolase